MGTIQRKPGPANFYLITARIDHYPRRCNYAAQLISIRSRVFRCGEPTAVHACGPPLLLVSLLAAHSELVGASDFGTTFLQSADDSGSASKGDRRRSIFETSNCEIWPSGNGRRSPQVQLTDKRTVSCLITCQRWEQRENKSKCSRGNT